MVTLPQVDRVQRISGASALWDDPRVASLLWNEYAEAPAVPSTAQVSATDASTLSLSGETASVYIQKFLAVTDSTGLSLVETANALLVGQESIVVDTTTFTLNESATTLVTYSEISTGDTLSLAITEGGSVTVTYVELSSSDIITSVLGEAASRADVTPPTRRLGGTWAQATRPWTGDTKAWGRGIGTDKETVTLSLGERAQVEILAVPISVADSGLLSFTDTASLFVSSAHADSTTLSLSEGRMLGGLASSTQTGETILLALDELPTVALYVEGHDEALLQLEGRFQVSKVFWPQEGDLPASDWGEEAKQPSNVWVLQAETLDSGFTKSNNLEKGDVWSKSKPPSPSV